MTLHHGGNHIEAGFVGAGPVGGDGREDVRRASARAGVTSSPMRNDAWTAPKALAKDNSRYGLHCAVWSADRDRALTFARQVRTGQIDINGSTYNPLAPFGGCKQSGNGREMGRLALDEFTEVKAIQT